MSEALGPIAHYLARYAEPEAARTRISAQFQHAIVVPVFAESLNWYSKLFPRGQPEDCLLIAVINTPDHLSAGHSDVVATRRLLTSDKHGCLVLDRVSQPLPKRQGVGLARKIGTDVALSLYAGGQLRSPWIYQTDADARLPANYLNHPLPAGGAVVFAHRHVSDSPMLQRAANLYDAHMRYYVDGIRRAGSHYAHKSLGSTIAVHAHDYAVVRGYPKRNAAEDFYLLNKLAKVSTIAAIDEVIIDLQARFSDRVPFGTGPALEKITTQLLEDHSGNSYLSYHPASFELLADALRLLREFAAMQTLPDHPAIDIVKQLGLTRVSDNIMRRYTTPKRRLQALIDWFDGLKTLRFIHLARAIHPDQPLLQSLSSRSICDNQRLESELI